MYSKRLVIEVRPNTAGLSMYNDVIVPMASSIIAVEVLIRYSLLISYSSQVSVNKFIQESLLSYFFEVSKAGFRERLSFFQETGGGGECFADFIP